MEPRFHIRSGKHEPVPVFPPYFVHAGFREVRIIFRIRAAPVCKPLVWRNSRCSISLAREILVWDLGNDMTAGFGEIPQLMGNRPLIVKVLQ